MGDVAGEDERQRDSTSSDETNTDVTTTPGSQRRRQAGRCPHLEQRSSRVSLLLHALPALFQSCANS